MALGGGTGGLRMRARGVCEGAHVGACLVLGVCEVVHEGTCLVLGVCGVVHIGTCLVRHPNTATTDLQACKVSLKQRSTAVQFAALGRDGQLYQLDLAGEPRGKG
jgi:hypothetical protein